MSGAELSEEERKGVAAIRSVVVDLPADLDTDFELRRWHIGWHGDLKEIAPRLKLYIANRRAAGFERPDFIEVINFKAFSTDASLRKHFGYIANSDPALPGAVSSTDNSIVLVHRLETDYAALVDFARTADILIVYFGFCEYMHQCVLRQEARSGRPSGISMLLDLEGASLSVYASPNAPANRLGKLCTWLMQEHFCEMLRRMVVVNPPRLVTLIWKLAKMALAEATMKKMSLASSHVDLRRELAPDAIPEAFGGTLRDDSGFTDRPALLALRPRDARHDPLPLQSLWHHPPPTDTHHLKPAAVFRKREELGEGQTLRWHFRVSGDVDFAVYRLGEGGGEAEIVFPLIRTASLKLAEEGSVVAKRGGPHELRFTNNSSYFFSIKLQLATDISDP